MSGPDAFSATTVSSASAEPIAAQSAAQGQTEELQRMLSQVMGSREGAALIQRIQKAVQK